MLAEEVPHAIMLLLLVVVARFASPLGTRLDGGLCPRAYLVYLTYTKGPWLLGLEGVLLIQLTTGPGLPAVSLITLRLLLMHLLVPHSFLRPTGLM